MNERDDWTREDEMDAEVSHDTRNAGTFTHERDDYSETEWSSSYDSFGDGDGPEWSDDDERAMQFYENAYARVHDIAPF